MDQSIGQLNFVLDLFHLEFLVLSYFFLFFEELSVLSLESGHLIGKEFLLGLWLTD